MTTMNNVPLAAAQIARIVEAVRAIDPDDEQLLVDMLEGETDLHIIASRLVDRIEADEGDIAALREQVDTRAARRRRIEARIDASRRALIVLLDAAGLDKLGLPEATLSKRMLPATVEVRDAEAVPDEFTKVVFKPDIAAIKAAFGAADTVPNWLSPVPARPSLTIRRS